MTKKELLEVSRQLLHVYSGILYHNQKFTEGNRGDFTYDFSCPEYKVLREMYHLADIAGKGTDFQRAKRLMHAFASRLPHASNYDNHVECNALKLLEYCLDNPEQGINCMNKSKILQEMCMAVGIYARRVWIMPYSPYDFDNHVVTEIFDRELNKWIMLDMTADTWFVNEEKMSLSILEIRSRFANDEFVTSVSYHDRMNDMERLRNRNMEMNAYICKNMFYFIIDQDSKFGDSDTRLLFAPAHFSRKQSVIGNTSFRINHMPEKYAEVITRLKNQLHILEESPEKECTDLLMMQKEPK